MCVARIIYPHTADKGYINPKILVSFYQKVYPLPPVIIFVKWVSKNCSINEYMNEFVAILKWINFKNGKFWEISKFNGYKKTFNSLNNLYFQIHLRNNQKE